MLARITYSKLLSCLVHNNLKTMSTALPCVYVRCIPDEERMQISVNYDHGGGRKVKTFNMERPQQETLGKAIVRLQQNIQKDICKRNRKKAPKEPIEEIAIQLLVNGQSLDEDLPNNQAWVDGAVLHVGTNILTVGVNLPTASSLAMPSSIMAGFPIFPRIDLEFADLNKSVFKWTRIACDRSNASSENGETSTGAGSPSQTDVQVSCDLIYTPTTNDIGHHLCLTCIPKNSSRTGKELSCTSKVAVEAGPGVCTFDSRHLFTPCEAGVGCFRVMSYNILADLYADSDFSREHLFGYCPPYALAIDYRRQLLLKEISGYKADIICLQEVDKKVFQGCLLPALDLLDYGGWLKLKGGEVNEGSATFYRRTKFKLFEQKDVVLASFVKEDPINNDIWAAVSSKPALREAIEQRTTALQVTVLESLEHEGRCLCVANTHLYFHPDADNIRIIQAVLSLRFIHQISTDLAKKGKTSAVVFCGDFNSSPKSGAVELITSGRIPADHSHWTSAPEERNVQLALSHDLELVSACGFPEYTNYTNGFYGTLDYIFSSPASLGVDRVVPMPTHAEVTLHVALPSVVHPSDHIALVCDLKWND